MQTFHYFIETPRFGSVGNESEHLPLSVCFASMEPVVRVRILTGSTIEDNVAFVTRPDIAKKQKHLPQEHHISIKSGKSAMELLGGKESIEVIAQFYHANQAYDLIKIPLRKYSYRESKEKKFAKYVSLLACPYCHNSVTSREAGFACGSCGKVYGRTGTAVDFLPPELRAEFAIVDTDNVSDHGLEPPVIEAVESNPGRLYIDVGAGFKYKCYENVVNLEIVDYPSTDVLGVGERLPFLDNSFDGVISSVVLEHVKDPFRCAQEMARILKPGGDIFCSAPLLQPMHGFPHHYYNMTCEGLVNLFPGFTVRKLDVPYYLDPLTALTWILNMYAQGLPENVQQQFLSMTVRDVLVNFSDFKSREHPVAAQLERYTRYSLACGTFLHGVKPA